MRILKTQLTPALAEWLRDAADDDRELLAQQVGEDIELTATMSVKIGQRTCTFTAGDLTPSEELEVKALLAAHAAEPLQKKRKS